MAASVAARNLGVVEKVLREDVVVGREIMAVR